MFRSLFPRKQVNTLDKTQAKSILRWVNGTLASRQLDVRDIEEDFKDGVNLCNLLEVLSGSSLKFRPRAILYAMKNDNCDIALRFMNSNGMKNEYQSEGIVKGEVNMAELLLKIYLYYQLVKPFGSDPMMDAAGADTKTGAVRCVTGWVNRKLPTPVADLTMFGNGNRLCSLVDTLAPEAGCVEKHRISSLDGTRSAISYAESKMGVAALLDAEDFMLDQEEFTYCIYLAQFLNFKGDSNGVDEAKRREEEARKAADGLSPRKPPPPSPKPASKWTRVKDGDRYYYWNEETDQTTWDKPEGYVDPDQQPPASPGAPLSDAAAAARAEANAARAKVEAEKLRAEAATAASNSAAEKRKALVWTKVRSDNGLYYFWNEKTDQTTWDKPADYEDPVPEDELKRLADEAAAANASLAALIAEADAAEARAVAAGGGSEEKKSASGDLEKKREAVDAAKARVAAALAIEKDAIEAESRARDELLKAESAMHQAELARTTADASHWTEVAASDGKAYYWNEATDETTWDKPSGFFSEAEKKERREQETIAKNEYRAKFDAIPAVEAATAAATANAKAAAAELATAETAFEDERRLGNGVASIERKEPPSSSGGGVQAARDRVNKATDAVMATAEAESKAQGDLRTAKAALDKITQDKATAAASKWTEVPSGDGKFYYWNEGNDQTTWDKPADFFSDADKAKLAADETAAQAEVETAKAAFEKAAAEATAAVNELDAADSALKVAEAEEARGGPRTEVKTDVYEDKELQVAESAVNEAVKALEIAKDAATQAQTSAAQSESEAADSTCTWTKVPSGDGKFYYWNEANDQTTWDAPDAYLEFERRKQRAAEAKQIAKEALEKAEAAQEALERAQTAFRNLRAEKEQAKTVSPTSASLGTFFGAPPSAPPASPPPPAKKSPWTAVKDSEGKTYYWNEETNATSWDKPADFEEPKPEVPKPPEKDPFAGLDSFGAKPDALAAAQAERARKESELEETKNALAAANAEIKAQQETKEAKEREAELLTAEADEAKRNIDKQPWTAVKADDGQTYYWNQRSDETAWDKPPGFIDDASVTKTQAAATTAKADATAAAEAVSAAIKKRDDLEMKQYSVEQDLRQARREEDQVREKLGLEKKDGGEVKELTKSEQIAAKAAKDEQYAKLVARAKCPWTAVKADNGQTYYWNEKTDVTSWDKPSDFVDVDDTTGLAAVIEELKQAEEEDAALAKAAKLKKEKEEEEEAEREAAKLKEEWAAKEKAAAASSLDGDQIKANAEAALKAAAATCLWTAVKADNGQTYYWNQRTDETAWDKPADFIDVDDPATKERFIRAEEEKFAKAKAEKEAEEKAKQEEVKKAEEKPKPKSKWTAVKDSYGKTYYWNEETDQTSWDKPAELAEQEEREAKEKEKEEKARELKEQEDKVRAQASRWTEVKDDTGKSYYWNQDTDQTTWDKPAILVELEELEKARKAQESADDAAALAFLNSAGGAPKSEPMDKDSEAALLLKLEERAKGRAMGRRNTGLMLMSLEAKADKLRRGSLPADPGLKPDLAVEFSGVSVAKIPSYPHSGTRLELIASCSNLVKFKWLAAICPLVGVFGRSSSDQPWQFLTRTEWIQSDTSPSFKIPIVLHDYSGQIQQICFKVYCVDDSSVDEDDVMGWAETTMQTLRENARYRDTLTLNLQTIPGRSADTSTARISLYCKSVEVSSVAISAGAAEIRHQALLRPGEKTARQAALKAVQAPAGSPPSADAVARAKADLTDDLDMGSSDQKEEDLQAGSRIRLEGYYLPYADGRDQLKLDVKCSRLIKMDWLSLSDPVVALFNQDRDSLLSQTEWQLNDHDPTFKTPLTTPLSEDGVTSLRLRVYDVDDEVVKADDMMGYADVSLTDLQASCFTNTPVEFVLKSTNRRRQKRLDKKCSTVTIHANFSG